MEGNITEETDNIAEVLVEVNVNINDQTAEEKLLMGVHVQQLEYNQSIFPILHLTGLL